MLRLFNFIFHFCFIFDVNAQVNSVDLAAIGSYSIPKSQSNSTAEIADYIKKNYKTDDQKVKAAYSWVTANIKYDKDSLHYVVLDENRDEKVTVAMRRRRGVCENFAAIFTDICIKSGIRSFVVEGYAVDGNIKKPPHAWSAAEIDREWFLFDPTWDAGSFNANYFKVAPATFIETHYPFDPLFQFLEFPINYSNFTGKSGKPAGYFNYKDTVNRLESSDSLDRYISQLSRIENNRWPPSLVDTKVKQLKLEIELIYQDDDMGNYNGAVADLNKATSLFNDFILYRNSQFIPSKMESEVFLTFEEIKSKISAANKKLIRVNSSTATLALNTGDVQFKLDQLAKKADEQKEFYNHYLNDLKEKQ
jgi:hypothetical protein